ncbi:MAG: serine/threonine protein kinase, partial [Gemmatimonadetes bacterium]|nr:serine/threonine protein kinase [Gemmatimonadota bacterium]
QGVVHRDVKPANILVDQNGAVVVTDFGIAKAREVDALTASGTSIGTPAYMSPEQAMGKRATPASDQYSLGVLAYELLSGRMPFTAETAMGVMYQHTHTPPDPLQELRPDLPPEVAGAVEPMLAKRPVDRFPTLAEASRALGIPASVGALDDPVRRELARLAGPGTVPKRRTSGSSGRSSSNPSGGPRPPSHPNATTLQILSLVRSRRLGVWLGGTALVLVTALGLVMWRRGRLVAPPPSVGASTATTGTPSATTPGAPPRPAVTTPRGAVVVPVSSTVQAAIERYRLAVESRDLALLLAAYPAMEPEQVAKYRDFFRTAERVRFEVVVKDLVEKDGEARMRLQGFIHYRDRQTGVGKITTYGTRARLVNGPTGWRILEIK